jgi:hypothetical protein
VNCMAMQWGLSSIIWRYNHHKVGNQSAWSMPSQPRLICWDPSLQ